MPDTLQDRMKWLKANGHGLKRTQVDVESIYRLLGRRPKIDVFVEIGVFDGGSLYMIAPFVKPGGLIIGIDPAKHYPGRKDPARGDRARAMIAQLVSDGYDARMIEKFSAAAIDDVKEILGDRQIDLLHIDGNHAYRFVKQDFDTYSPLVVKGGIVLMHDIKNPKCGVPGYWKLVKRWYEKRAVELLPNDPTKGSGVVYL